MINEFCNLNETSENSLIVTFGYSWQHILYSLQHIYYLLEMK